MLTVTLYVVEVEQSSLTLRSLNDSKTAFGSVEFMDHYFDSYIVNETKSFSCKLTLKVCELDVLIVCLILCSPYVSLLEISRMFALLESLQVELVQSTKFHLR